MKRSLMTLAAAAIMAVSASSAFAGEFNIVRAEHSQMPALCGINADANANGGAGPAWAGCSNPKTNTVVLSYGLQNGLVAKVYGEQVASLRAGRHGVSQYPNKYMFITAKEYAAGLGRLNFMNY